MPIRLMVACGLLLAANQVSAQHACGPGCRGGDAGGQTLQQLDRYYNAPPASDFGRNSSVDSRSLGYGPMSPQMSRDYRAAAPGYLDYNRRWPLDHQMMQNPDANAFQQPRSYGDSNHRQHGGVCNHGDGHSHHDATHQRGAGLYRQSPRRNPIAPQLQDPFPDDLQPMAPPSLPPSFPQQSTARNRAPDSQPLRSNRGWNTRLNRSGYINL